MPYFCLLLLPLVLQGSSYPDTPTTGVMLAERKKNSISKRNITKVLFSIPIIRSVPQTIAEWVFAVYVLGILVFIIKYLISYFKLRRLLKLGDVPCDEKLAQIGKIASEQGVKLGKVIEVSGLPSAFVCGVFRPILVIPAENEFNEKIILHELFHLKNRVSLRRHPFSVKKFVLTRQKDKIQRKNK